MTNYYTQAAFNFQVEFGIDGVQNNNSVFQEISGIEPETNVINYREGGANRFVHELPRAIKHSNISLKKGVVSDPQIIKWLQDTLFGGLSNPIEPVDMKIKLMDQNTEAAMVWKVTGAWPVKLEASALKATSHNEIAVETMEFSFKSIERLSI